MTDELARLLIDGSTCVAAIGLTIATCVLVRATRDHARHAEQLALAARQLAESLDQQGTAMVDASDLHALVNAAGASTGGTNYAELRQLADALYQRRQTRAGTVSNPPPTHS